MGFLKIVVYRWAGGCSHQTQTAARDGEPQALQELRAPDGFSIPQPPAAAAPFTQGSLSMAGCLKHCGCIVPRLSWQSVSPDREGMQKPAGAPGHGPSADCDPSSQNAPLDDRIRGPPALRLMSWVQTCHPRSVCYALLRIHLPPRRRLSPGGLFKALRLP